MREGVPPRPRIRRDHAALPGRVAELDGLRGLAALAVVVFHSNSNRLPIGWAAVDLFFVLSGYLITGIVLRNGRTPGFLPRFYLRRGLRVWPIYYLLIAALLVAAPVMTRPLNWAGLPFVLTFTQGVPAYWGAVSPNFSPYLGHAWTLAIEEQFYLVWPMLILLVGRRGVIPMAVACIVGSTLARGWGLGLNLLLARCDGLALGAVLSVVLEPGRLRDPSTRDRLAARFLTLIVLSSIALVALRYVGGKGSLKIHPRWPGTTILIFNILWFGMVGWTAVRAGSPRCAWLRRPGPQRLGAMSYGLYLYHLVVMLTFHDLAKRLGYPMTPPWLSTTSLVACFLIAWVSWVYLEQPILRWKDRLAAYRLQPPGPSPAVHAPARTHSPALVSGQRIPPLNP